MASRFLLSVLTLLSLLATLGVAGPLPDFKGLHLIEKRQQQQNTTGCDFFLHDDQPASREAIWGDKGLGVGRFLDDWLTKNGQQDWLHRMDQQLFSVGESSIRCITIGGTDCDGPSSDECPLYAAKKVPQLYWILKMAQTYYGLTNAMWINFNTEALNNTLQLPELASVYQSQPNNWQIGNWNYMAAIQQALVLTAGFAARNPAIGGPATIGVGVTGELNTYAPKAEDISADISNGMSDAFQGAMGGLKAMLGLAMAGKDLTGRGKTTADLPNRTGNWKNDITKFFDQGRFLISDQQAAIQPIISGWAKYSKQIMAVKGLMAQGYFVFIDSTITTEADCTGAGGSGAGHAGRKWINDGKAQSCASLWKFGKYTKKMLWATNGAQEDTMTKAMQAPSTGGFNLKDVYTNAVQCARAHPGGNGQMVSNKNLVPTYITSAPPCFYNFQVVKGHAINLAFAQHLTVDMSDPINTSGR